MSARSKADRAHVISMRNAKTCMAHMLVPVWMVSPGTAKSALILTNVYLLKTQIKSCAIILENVSIQWVIMIVNVNKVLSTEITLLYVLVNKFS